jgi:predicted peptidase
MLALLLVFADATPHALTRAVPVNLRYLLVTPAGHADGAKTWPTILFLHGSGERGDDLEQVKKNGPPKVALAKPDFPFLVAAPQCPKDTYWNPAEVLALADELVEKHKADSDRLYLTGLSMGGSGAWDTACQYPGKFAAIAPVCGSGKVWRANYLKHTPVWAFHGANDVGVPVARSADMVAAAKKAGGKAELTVYPDLGHDCWTRTYDDPKLYAWFLSHTRKAP